MIEIRRADELGERHRRAVAEVLVRGFAEDFAYFSPDPEVLADMFAPMLLLDRFHVALLDDVPAAIASVTEGEQECFEPHRRAIQRSLGWWHGLAACVIVRTQFLGAYDGARPGLAEIGFVTTAPQFRGRGIATALMRHLLRLPYDEFVLRDIKDTNEPALALYRKLGFVEKRTRPVRFPRRAGFSSYVTMSFERAQAAQP